jgi:hypothetical protein
MDRIPHRGVERAFDADDLDRGFDRMRRNGIAGDESAAADRNDQDLELRNVLKHFRRDGALAGDDMRVVIGMDPD